MPRHHGHMWSSADAGSDIARETAAMQQVGVDLAGDGKDLAADGSGGVEAGANVEAAAPGCAPQRWEDMWLARWITGHHIHVMFNVYAAFALREGVPGTAGGAWPEATALLARATVHVRGSPLPVPTRQRCRSSTTRAPCAPRWFPPWCRCR